MHEDKSSVEITCSQLCIVIRAYMPPERDFPINLEVKRFEMIKKKTQNKIEHLNYNELWAEAINCLQMINYGKWLPL